MIIIHWRCSQLLFDDDDDDGDGDDAVVYTKDRTFILT